MVLCNIKCEEKLEWENLSWVENNGIWNIKFQKETEEPDEKPVWSDIRLSQFEGNIIDEFKIPLYFPEIDGEGKAFLFVVFIANFHCHLF